MAPLGIETRIEDDKIRCELCLKYNSLSYRGDWIALRTYKTKHQKTSVHLDSVSQQLQEMASENCCLQETPGYFVTPKNIDVGVLPTHDRAAAYDPMQEVWDTFDGTFELEDGATEIHEKARNVFELQANLSGLWAGLEAIPDGDIDEIQQHWEEEEEDDLLSEIFEQIGMILQYLVYSGTDAWSK